MSRLRCLTTTDYLTIAHNFSVTQTFMDGAATILGNLQGRMDAVEGENLASRMSAAESGLSGHGTRLSALETWRSNKAGAIANETAMTVSTTIATDIITLGLAAPRASSIETAINAVKTEINGLKTKINSILAANRSREIIAV